MPTSNHVSRAAALAALASSFCLTGCLVVLPEAPTPSTTVPRHVAVLTTGVEIVAEDQTWTLGGSDPVEPPFVNGTPGYTLSDDMLDAYDAFLGQGAQLVRVRVTGREKPLFGVLSLAPVFATSKESSAKRTYRIAVPAERVQDALGGQVSVVYQPYVYERSTRRTNELGDHFYAREDATGASWTLWLSDAPFPGQEVASPQN